VNYPNKPPSYKLYDYDAIEKESEWKIHNVHDPALVKDGDYYYIFSTDCKVLAKDRQVPAGIQVRKSPDLIHWEWVGYALSGVPEAAYQWTGASTLWAPDVCKLGDTYYLYYSASQFGKNQSFIGVATSKSIDGPWIDQGEVYKTEQGDPMNAIDPNIVIDHEGQPWMVYGSFFEGIYITRINPQTGKLLEPGSGTLIARRHHHVEGAVEGPYIIYNEQYKKYYLFVSYDSLFENYNIRVGRSESITGPYVDINGNRFTDIEHFPQSEVGNKILGSYSFAQDYGWIAPGHNSVLKDDQEYFIAHHARGGKDKRWPYLHIRRILWTDNGWPVVSPQRYAGEKVQKLEGDEIKGIWEIILLDRANNYQIKSIEIEISHQSNYRFESDKQTFYVSLNTPFIGGEFALKLLPAWDWEKDRPCLVFSGLDRQGLCLWGKKIA